MTAPGRWRRSGTTPPSGSPSIVNCRGLAAGHPREVADLGHDGVEQPPVAPARHADDADLRQRREPLAGRRHLLRDDDDLGVQRSLELVGQPEADAARRTRATPPASGPGPGPRSAAGGARPRATAGDRPPPGRARVGVEPVGSSSATAVPAGGVEDERAALQPLRPALLLVARALEPAVHRHDLRHRQSLRIHDPLGLGPLFARVELGHPDAQRAVGAAEPLERRVGQQVRATPPARSPVRRGAGPRPSPPRRLRARRAPAAELIPEATRGGGTRDRWSARSAHRRRAPRDNPRASGARA